MIDNDSVITIKEIEKLFKCSKSTAWRKLGIARDILGKKRNNGKKKGGDPVTVEQFKNALNI